MPTQFNKDSLLFAEPHITPIGPRVVLLIEGKSVVGMAPEQAADFGALLIHKSAEALRDWAEEIDGASDERAPAARL